ncbi:MAG: PhoH family protein [Magnetococcus sp. WYHC-3]
MPKQHTATLQFPDNRLAALLYGTTDRHLKLVEAELGVAIHSRGNTLTLSGRKVPLKKACTLLGELYHMLEKGQSVDSARIQDGLRSLTEDQPLAEIFSEDAALRTPLRQIFPRGPTQARYLRAFSEADLVFGIGPAGTGKTYLAVAVAVAALTERRVARIILTRPAVEAGERLGFLPGDLQAKIDPYLRPLYDALFDTLGAERLDKMLERGEVEVAPLAYMRGRTLEEAFVILDEAQNTTREQMKMFLTRLGARSCAAVTGDVTQIDLPSPQRSGLVQALDVLAGVEGIRFVQFSDGDVVRHPLVRRIVRAYQRADQGVQPGTEGHQS